METTISSPTRWRVAGHARNTTGDGFTYILSQHPDGDYVTWADHQTTVAEIYTLMGAAIQSGIDAERERIRVAVAALEPLLDVDKRSGGYDCCGCSTPNQLHEDVLAIITEES